MSASVLLIFFSIVAMSVCAIVLWKRHTCFILSTLINIHLHNVLHLEKLSSNQAKEFQNLYALIQPFIVAMQEGKSFDYFQNHVTVMKSSESNEITNEILRAIKLGENSTKKLISWYIILCKMFHAYRSSV